VALPSFAGPFLFNPSARLQQDVDNLNAAFAAQFKLELNSLLPREAPSSRAAASLSFPLKYMKRKSSQEQS
jgi:hypothetical protein